MDGEQYAGLRLTIVGPLPPPSGGMANQCKQLVGLLQAEGVQVELVRTNAPYKPAFVGKVPVLRAFARLLPYLLALWRASGRTDVMHVLANSGWSWHLFSAPAIWIARLRGTPVVVNYRGGEAEPFFAAAPPKSTGPEYFTADWLQRHLTAVGTLPPTDVQATLLALTARSIADAIKALPDLARPDIFVCGGGAHNGALMRALRGNLSGSTVAPTDTLGVAGDWVEAMAFAWLARQRLHALPGNCPRVTGASRPAVLGGLWLPE